MRVWGGGCWGGDIYIAKWQISKREVLREISRINVTSSLWGGSKPEWVRVHGKPMLLGGWTPLVGLLGRRSWLILLGWTVTYAVENFTEAGFSEQAIASQEQDLGGKSLLPMQSVDTLSSLSSTLDQPWKFAGATARCCGQGRLEDEDPSGFLASSLPQAIPVPIFCKTPSIQELDWGLIPVREHPLLFTSSRPQCIVYSTIEECLVGQVLLISPQEANAPWIEEVFRKEKCGLHISPRSFSVQPDASYKCFILPVYFGGWPFLPSPTSRPLPSLSLASGSWEQLAWGPWVIAPDIIIFFYHFNFLIFLNNVHWALWRVEWTTWKLRVILWY